MKRYYEYELLEVENKKLKDEVARLEKLANHWIEKYMVDIVQLKIYTPKEIK